MGTIVLETCLAYENSFWEQEHGNILSFKEGIGRRQQKEENFVAKVSSWSKNPCLPLPPKSYTLKILWWKRIFNTLFKNKV